MVDQTPSLGHGLSRERLRVSIGSKQQRLVFALFKHEAGILEMIDQCIAALDSCISHTTDLVTVEFIPLLLVNMFDKRDDVFLLHHVDEPITDIALVLEIDR